jgi:DNA-binding transcriptional ArsR family regulator
VSELAEAEGEKITTVSARLKTLAGVGLVRRRCEAKHVFFTLNAFIDRIHIAAKCKNSEGVVRPVGPCLPTLGRTL